LTDIDRPLFGGCHPATVRAIRQHDPGIDMPDTIAGWHALWWARFHGCAEVLTLIGAPPRPRAEGRGHDNDD
jgi:hypothetical protein